jgi:Tol biopolymer transport system component/pimeloyl-ACP methyl ester carboxylesterase
MRHNLLFVMLITVAALLVPARMPQAAEVCHPVVSGNQPGQSGTTHVMAYDGDPTTFFKSSSTNWQYIQIDLSCVGTFSGLRRHMSRDGSNIQGNRGNQGERVAYSIDGVQWTDLTSSTTTGWQGYTNYQPYAWHSVVYGWSARLNLNAPVQARYVRFHWDGAGDALNEIEITFTEPPPAPLPLTLPGQHVWPMLSHDAAHSAFTDLTGPEDASSLPPWPFRADASIRSAPAIGSDGTAYVGDDNGNLYALHSMAPDQAQLLKWRFQAARHASGNRILSAPALKDGLEASPVRVYFATEQGDIYSLNARDGTQVWRHQLNTRVSSSPALFMPRGHGLVRLYLRADDGIYLLEETGLLHAPTVTARRLHGIGVGPGTSVALSRDGSQLYATDGVQTLYVLDANTGQDLCPRLTFSNSTALTSPVVDPDGYVYVGSSNGTLYKYTPYPAGVNGNCPRRWALQLGGPVRTPAFAPDGLVVALGGTTLYAADRGSGALTCPACWQFPAPWADSAPAVVDGAGIVYAAGRDAKARAIRKGRLLWEYAAGQTGGFTTPAIDGFGRLYVGSIDRHLYVLPDKPAFKIAFESDLSQAQNVDVHTLREIYGATERPRTIRVTEHPAYDGQPTYSIDGRWLAFASARGSSYDIWLGASGGVETRNLSEVPQPGQPGLPFRTTKEHEPAFSATDLDGRSRLPRGGRYLALTHGDDVKRLKFVDLDELWQSGTLSPIDLSGWLQRQIPAGGAGIVTGAEQSQAAFSPDGHHLAYSACTNDALGNAVNELVWIDLYQTAAQARTVVATLRRPGNCFRDFADFAPAFSPDSRYLIYHNEPAANTHALVVRELKRTPPFTSVSISFSGLEARRPAWSPDGTEIVFAGKDRNGVAGLYIAQGPNYRIATLLTDDLQPPATARFDHPDYHPARLPQPRLSSNCAVDQLNPLALQPAAQRPQETIEIRGCGFDVKFPTRNRVYFTHASNRRLWVEGAVESARVDVASGQAVLVVRVPYLAGDGPVSLITAFGQASVPNFTVIPWPIALIKSSSIAGAKIRIMGYGFQIRDASHSRLNRVFFTGPGGAQNLEATVHTSTLEPCDTVLTPCPAGAPLEGSARKVEWIEVTIPSGVVPGPVRVTNDAIAAGNQCCAFALLQPRITLSRDSGSEGEGGPPGGRLGPTLFDMSGEEFPYDPYFGSVQADLRQIAADGVTSIGLAAPVSLQPYGSQQDRGRFTARRLYVQTDLTGHGGTLTMAAVGLGSGARATQPFHTPLRNLPIIFVPGTSGTYITNQSDEEIQHGFCLWEGGSNTYAPRENIWMNESTILHLLGGCQGYLDAVKFGPHSDEPYHPAFANVDVGDIFKRIRLPEVPLGGDRLVYEPLFQYIEGTLGRPQPTAGNPWPLNGLYSFRLDWRKSFQGQADLLANLVDQVIAHTGKPKVVIISHSVGGPVTQYYLRTRDDAHTKVDQVISLGGGFMGVVLPYKILQVGDDWGLNKDLLLFTYSVLDPNKTQDLAQNWPTAYWQLPQSNWFSDRNGACPDGDCSFIWEEGWDVDSDGGCGSRSGGGAYSCDSPNTPDGFLGPHHNAQAALDFMRNAPHDGCSDCDSDRVNQAKFDSARSSLLATPPSVSLDCTRLGQQYHAGLGDWTCGTQGVFFHRVVGFGTEDEDVTVGRIHFHTESICANAGVAALSIYFSAGLACVADEEIREPVYVDGDGTIPLRSAVGILVGFDDRIWGVDWKSAQIQAEERDYYKDADAFHRELTQDAFVHQLIGYLTRGRISERSQMPVLVGSEAYFKTTPGIPAPLAAPAANALAAAPSAAEAPDTIQRWRGILAGHAAVHIYDQAGRHSGPRATTPGSIENNIPGVSYDRGPNYTHISLPGNGVYTLALESGGKVDLDLVNLKLSALTDSTVSRMITFLGVPISRTTTVQLVWNAGNVPERPSLRLDFRGDGQSFSWPADGVLVGQAASDRTRPTTAIQVQNNRLSISADDAGGTGIYQIVYGTDREQKLGRVYTGPVDLPPGTTYIWAFATDRAGNAQNRATIYQVRPN